MLKYSYILLIFLIGCATSTPLKELPKGTKLVKVTYMNPDKKVCSYKRTIKTGCETCSYFDDVQEDVRHLATESKSNVAKLVSKSGPSMLIELYACPDKYVQNYLKKNFKQ